MPIGLYKCFRDELAEWIVARNKVEALNYLDVLWGGLAKQEYFRQYKKENPLASYEKFAEDLFQEEPYEKEFTVIKNNGQAITMTVKEWLDQIRIAPTFFSYQYFNGDEYNGSQNRD